jgi:carboxyl-terminal processing protease
VNNTILESRKPAGPRFPRKILLIFLALILAVHFCLPGLAAPPQGYDSLRLYTEALFEIAQKYVWPKSEEEMIYGSLRGMMNSLDPDSSFLTPKEYQDYLRGQKSQSAEAGVELVLKDNLLTAVSVLDNGPAGRAGLMAGDHILKIDGQPVRNLTTQEAAHRFTGASGTPVKVQVIRNGQVKPLDLTFKLEPLGSTTVSSKFLGDAIAYVRVSYFNDGTAEEFARAVNLIKKHRPPIQGVVLDLRNNARGELPQAVQTAAVLLGDQQIASTKGRPADSEVSYKGKDRDRILKSILPLIVLVDQGTARAAEIVAGALRDQFQAKLLGAKTLGLCGLTKAMPLQDGSALIMTVALCYTPHGQKIQGKGLDPEIPGKALALTKPPAKGAPRPEVLSPDQDPWVQQALEVLKSEKGRRVAQATKSE